MADIDIDLPPDTIRWPLGLIDEAITLIDRTDDIVTNGTDVSTSLLWEGSWRSLLDEVVIPSTWLVFFNSLAETNPVPHRVLFEGEEPPDPEETKRAVRDRNEQLSKFVHGIREKLETAGAETPPNLLFSERAEVESSGGSKGAFQRLVDGLVVDLARRGYFLRAGSAGEVGTGYETLSLIGVIVGQVGPIASWPLESVFNGLEVLYRASARPVRRHMLGTPQTGAPCSGRVGRGVFRYRLNQIFAQCQPLYQMNESGVVVRVLPTEVASVAGRVAEGGPDKEREGRELAVLTLIARGDSMEELRNAARTLCGFLESRKHLMTAQGGLFTKDVSDLFQIANTFRIRHSDSIKETQKGDYSVNVMRWLVTWFLITLDLLDAEGVAPV